MPELTFIGNIQKYAYNSANVQEDHRQSFPLDFLGSQVTWTSTIPPGIRTPPSINQATLAQLMANKSYQVRTTVTVEVTGAQNTLLYADNAVTSGALISGGKIIQPFEYVATNKGPPTRIYEIKRTYEGIGIPDLVDIYVHNNCVDLFTQKVGLCYSGAQFPATNYTFKVTLNVTLVINCSGNTLTDPVCTSFCTDNSACIQDMLGYCFPDRIGRIDGEGQLCRTYISQYLTKNRNPELDSRLQTYCTTKFKSLQDLVSANPTDPVQRTDQQLCACQLPQSEYTKLTANLESILGPGVGPLGIIPQCLAPASLCSTSLFKPSFIPVTGCNVPGCLNIAAVNLGEAVIDSSKIVIDQTGVCAGLKIPSPGPRPNPSPTGPVVPIQPQPSQPASNTQSIVFGVAAGIVILILLILIAVVIMRR